jgi:hypothetical protein
LQRAIGTRNNYNMGHTRLGKIPTTRKWREVVEVFASAKSQAELSAQSTEIAQLAASTVRASSEALRAGIKDGGLAFIFYFLTQLALTTRRTQPREALAALGLRLPHNPTNLDLTIEVHRLIDEHFKSVGQKSDVAEMAQLAVGETLASYLRNRPRDLFASSEAQLFSDLHQLGSQRTFGEVSRVFFSNFMSRMLGFYLSKFVLPGGRQRMVNSADDLTQFNIALKQHTYQRAAIIHQFAEKWFSKTEFERGIDASNARRFVSYACKKLESEFLQGMGGE